MTSTTSANPPSLSREGIKGWVTAERGRSPRRRFWRPRAHRAPSATTHPQTPPLKGRGFLLSPVFLLFLGAAPAFADMLVDNVNGYTMREDGQLLRFNGIWIGDDGQGAPAASSAATRGRRAPAS